MPTRFIDNLFNRVSTLRLLRRGSNLGDNETEQLEIDSTVAPMGNQVHIAGPDVIQHLLSQLSFDSMSASSNAANAASSAAFASKAAANASAASANAAVHAADAAGAASDSAIAAADTASSATKVNETCQSLFTLCFPEGAVNTTYRQRIRVVTPTSAREEGTAQLSFGEDSGFAEVDLGHGGDIEETTGYSDDELTIDLLQNFEVAAKSSNNIKPADAGTETPSKPKGLPRFPSNDSLATHNLRAALRDDAASDDGSSGYQSDPNDMDYDDDKQEDGEEDAPASVGDRGMSICFAAAAAEALAPEDGYKEDDGDDDDESLAGVDYLLDRVMTDVSSNITDIGTIKSMPIARQHFRRALALLKTKYGKLLINDKVNFPGIGTTVLRSFPVATNSARTGFRILLQGWLPTNETSVHNLNCGTLRTANAINALVQYLEEPLLEAHEIKAFSSFSVGRDIPKPRIGNCVNFGESKLFVTATGMIVLAVDHIPTGCVLVRHYSRDPVAEGYPQLCFDGDDPKTGKAMKTTIKAHRLVAFAFLGHDTPPTYYSQSVGKRLNCTVDHINRIRHDNRAVNLRWATNQEQKLNSGNKKGFKKQRISK